jgi:hypothetical protein
MPLEGDPTKEEIAEMHKERLKKEQETAMSDREKILAAFKNHKRGRL